MQTTNNRYTFAPMGNTWFCPSLGMTIDIFLGVPEVVEFIHSRYFHALRFGDESVEYFAILTPSGTIEVKQTYRTI